MVHNLLFRQPLKPSWSQRNHRKPKARKETSATKTRLELPFWNVKVRGWALTRGLIASKRLLQDFCYRSDSWPCLPLMHCGELCQGLHSHSEHETLKSVMASKSDFAVGWFLDLRTFRVHDVWIQFQLYVLRMHDIYIYKYILKFASMSAVSAHPLWGSLFPSPARFKLLDFHQASPVCGWWKRNRWEC